ncbi:MAG TPA: non-heme iron oxygenase ferredoxin subunit [Actinomycetes bacterium]|nr:non-heme iron oxygenase ferredoxin subunit [Actinomycetes bacterium]
MQVRACALDDLPVGTAIRVDLGDASLCLVRTAAAVHAVDDVCTHAEVSLSDGDVDGETIECWLHGSRFDLATGRPSGPPAVAPVAVYPVTVEGGDVLIDLPTVRS